MERRARGLRGARRRPGDAAQRGRQCGRLEDRAPVLEQLLSMDVHILPSETIFYSLRGSAEHPQFREFNELVKEA